MHYKSSLCQCDRQQNQKAPSICAHWFGYPTLLPYVTQGSQGTGKDIIKYPAVLAKYSVYLLSTMRRTWRATEIEMTAYQPELIDQKFDRMTEESFSRLELHLTRMQHVKRRLFVSFVTRMCGALSKLFFFVKMCNCDIYLVFSCTCKGCSGFEQ